MDQCIFCKIISGQLPCFKIYEDNDFLCFLDIRPREAGHTLVIPKKHYRFVWDVPNTGQYFEVAKKIALAQQKAFGNELIFSRINGEEIPHAHIWIYPESTKDNKEDFENNSKKIINSLS